jgi:hypothetical protein
VIFCEWAENRAVGKHEDLHLGGEAMRLVIAAAAVAFVAGLSTVVEAEIPGICVPAPGYPCTLPGGTGPGPIEPPQQDPTDVAVQESIRLNNEGIQLYTQGSYGAALEKFRAAYSQEPFPDSARGRSTMSNVRGTEAMIAWGNGNLFDAYDKAWSAVQYKDAPVWKDLLLNIGNRIVAEQPGQPIGAAGGLQGDVRYQFPDGRWIRPTPGMTIKLGIRVLTGDKSRFQAQLADQTVFTLGPGADMVMDRFVYDPNDRGGRISAAITVGVFRWVTGKVAGEDPATIQIKVPSGCICIRGTDLDALVRPDGSGQVTTYKGEVIFRGEKSNVDVSIPAGKWLAFSASGYPDGLTNSPTADKPFHFVATTQPPDAYLSLRTSPSGGQEIAQMLNGTLLQVLNRRDDGWWHVRVYPSGQQGWTLNRQGERVWIYCCAASHDRPN